MLFIFTFLFTQVHTILGSGDQSANTPPERTGQMSDPVASPNDPVFIVHHTMTDCVFDGWLKHHPDEEYPDVPLTFNTRGHQAHSFMIPFLPLYTNADMFKPANNFGYYCNLPNITIDANDVNSGAIPNSIQSTVVTCLSVIFIILAVLY